ncbi:Family of unknown function (DUF5309) [uncultured Caudovirales phage]|uniref:Head protein n=1 Tax=uncultured Caudovirales phage TaxID=2100421 RepID=A0A6J5KWE9_9CAUD|nr:Family of unknown function (DUF5309) [uncultured Caudovirales phage]
MATYQTYTAIGQREDLSDVIYNISPTETPFMSSVGKGKATAVYHEWQTDSLAAVNTSNAAVEGATASDATMSPTARVGNRTQISQKTVKISGTLEAVNKAGRKSEKAYQLAKASSEIKRDMEAILLSNQVAAAGNSTTARTLGGLQAWLASNTSNGSGGSAGANGTTARTTGTDRSFTATLLNTVMQSAYTNGGSPTMLLVTPAQKVVASTFTGIATRYRDVPANQQAQIINAADVYVSDFGIIQIVPDRFIPNSDNDDTAFLLDTEMASVAYLRPFQTVELAQTGDAELTQLLVEYTLEVKNEAAHGIISDLT